ncbi:hypothetical protein [Robertkochia aurantiaca]|uniref:hypothetical protein n=1 Tax=Robertkochia aurantiaca TaxID=2873700 RepID=UPI001CCE0332|nr:hypothetical protein [Robertkochia sp. 3YJGBD-33]
MKEKDNIEKLFDSLQNQFDLEEPRAGHQDRFAARLEAQRNSEADGSSQGSSWWKVLSVAAAITLIVTVAASLFFTQQQNDQMPEEFQKTEFYFASVIEEEMQKVEAAATPETRKLIDDTMLQMEKLESDYELLVEELREEGNRKQILHAMITNFETRINLLQDVLDRIEEIKEFKSDNDEANII